MGTYGDMQGRIADELARSNLTDQIRKAIQSAIDFYKGERFWFNEGELGIDTIVAQDSYAMPIQFEEIDVATVTAYGDRYEIHPATYDWIRGQQIQETILGRPWKYAIFEEYFWVYPAPDQVYPIIISGTWDLGTLSDASDTNAWMAEAEELIRMRAKWDLYFNVIRNDKEAQKMQMAEQRALSSLVRKTVSRLSSGRVKPTVF